jgi:hypothetical protein
MRKNTNNLSNFISKPSTKKQANNEVIRLIPVCNHWLLRLFCLENKVEIRFFYNSMNVNFGGCGKNVFVIIGKCVLL